MCKLGIWTPQSRLAVPSFYRQPARHPNPTTPTETHLRRRQHLVLRVCVAICRRDVVHQPRQQLLVLRNVLQEAHCTDTGAHRRVRECPLNRPGVSPAGKYDRGQAACCPQLFACPLPALHLPLRPAGPAAPPCPGSAAQ